MERQYNDIFTEGVPCVRELNAWGNAKNKKQQS